MPGPSFRHWIAAIMLLIAVIAGVWLVPRGWESEQSAERFRAAAGSGRSPATVNPRARAATSNSERGGLSPGAMARAGAEDYLNSLPQRGRGKWRALYGDGDRI